MISPPAELVARLRGSRFLAVDPGTEHPAAAIYDRGELQIASRVKLPSALVRMTAQLKQGERSRQIAKCIVAWYWDQSRGPARVRPEIVLCEWPQIYTYSKGKGNPNKLIPLAAIGAAVASLFDVEAVSVEPDEWIGNIPKDEDLPLELSWESPRGKFIRSRLSPAEVARVVLSHDAVDSAGVGKWGIGGLERRYPGCV